MRDDQVLGLRPHVQKLGEHILCRTAKARFVKIRFIDNAGVYMRAGDVDHRLKAMIEWAVRQRQGMQAGQGVGE
jgi:hypothetical protein